MTYRTRQHRPRMPHKPGARFYIYRVWRKETGALLYVGSTCNLSERMKAHETQPWWHVVDYVTTDYVGTDMLAARATEKQVIHDECPRFNITWRNPRHPDGYAGVVATIYGFHPEDFERAPEGWGGVVSEHLPPGEKVYLLNRLGYPVPDELRAAADEETRLLEEQWAAEDAARLSP